MVKILNRSLGLPSYKEIRIHSIKLVSFPLLLQVVAEYHFFHVSYTLWCLLRVFVASFGYPSLLKSWSILLCASSCVVSLETSDLTGVPLYAILHVCFVVSFWTFGCIMS
jgi:hypothetical protein